MQYGLIPYPGPESHLSGIHGRGRLAGAGSVRQLQGQLLPADKPELAGKLDQPGATFFAYPADILKVIYTTNAIESLNSESRHAIKKRKVFPTDGAVKKVV